MTDFQILFRLLPRSTVMPVLDELRKLSADLAEKVSWAVSNFITERIIVIFPHPPQQQVYQNIVRIYKEEAQKHSQTSFKI